MITRAKGRTFLLKESLFGILIEEGSVNRDIKPRLLIVDDVRTTREYLHVALQEDFEIVGGAEDVPTALQSILSTDPDLCLLDIVMPGRSGLEVLRPFRPRDGAAPRRPRFVVLSGCRRDEIVREAFLLGASEYLFKPMEAERLSQILRDTYLRWEREREEY